MIFPNPPKNSKKLIKLALNEIKEWRKFLVLLKKIDRKKTNINKK